jgi:acetyltransferase-like isoleucine patch superfamily enzyme
MIKQGVGSVVAADFKHGKNFVMGNYCIIQEGCEVGDNVKLEHFVLLKKGTKIGDNVYVDSYVKSSGDNQIGSGVILRFNATIAREVTIENEVFISPNVMTIYSDHKGKAHPGTVVGKGSHIGTNAVIGHGIKIAPGTVVGALSMVTKDIEQPGIYAGVPAVKIKDI